MSFEGYNVVDKGGKAARKRFSSPLAVRAVYQKLKDDDLKEAERRAKILRMYSGNLPYDPEKLKQSGLKNLANINFHGLKGVIDNRADVILRLSSDTANLVELRPMRREIAGPAAEHIGRVVAEEFSFALRDQGDFIPALAMMNKESDLYGLGPVTFEHGLDYKPIALERAQVKFIGNAPVHSTKHDLIMYESVFPASYIFMLLDNPKIAESEGWNVSQLKEWVVRVFQVGEETADEPGNSPGLSSVETQISLLRRNMFEEEHQFDELKVIHVLVKEMAFPRGITHLIIPASACGDNERFLYERENAYKTLDEVFLWFPYSINERYARAVRGLGSTLYATEAVSNRFKCAFIDAAFRSMSIMFTQAPGGSQQAVTLNEQGPFTFVPKDLTPIQNNVKPDLQTAVQVIQYVDQIGVASVEGTDRAPLGSTAPKLFNAPDRQQTKAEIELQQKLRGHKDEALFTQRLQVVDKLVRQSFLRFVKLVGLIAGGDLLLAADFPEIVAFIDRCAKREVQVKDILAIPAAYTIVTCRDLVLGSDGKVGVLAEIIGGPAAGILDEAGRRAAMRDAVQLRLGVQSADRYIPEIGRDSAPSDQASFATVENALIKLGQAVAVGNDQLHWSHIPVHAQVLQEIVQAVGAPDDNDPNSQQDPEVLAQQLENPKQLLAVLVACSKHIQEHLAIAKMQPGKEEDAKKVAAMLRDLRPTIKSLNLAVATQERVEQAQREKEQREMEELQRRADANEVEKAKVEADKKAETDRYRIDREHEVALRRLELDRELAAGKAGLDREVVAASEARKNAEAAGKAERDQQLHRAKINAANAVQRFNSVQDATGFGRTTPADVMGNEGSDELDLTAL